MKFPPAAAESYQNCRPLLFDQLIDQWRWADRRWPDPKGRGKRLPDGGNVRVGPGMNRAYSASGRHVFTEFHQIRDPDCVVDRSRDAATAGAQQQRSLGDCHRIDIGDIS